MKKKLSLILVVVLLFSLLPYSISFASDTNVYNLSKNKKFESKSLLNIHNVALTELNQANDADVIWVQDDMLLEPGVKESIKEKLNNGAEVYLVKKGISLKEAVDYLGLDNAVKADLPAPKMDLSKAPKELQDQIKAGKKVIIRDARKNNTTTIFGIKKVNDSYSSLEVAFDSVSDDKTKEFLFDKTITKELQANLIRQEIAKIASSYIPVRFKQNTALAISDWPVAWTNSRTDSYVGVTVQWNLTLQRHPDNPNNPNQKVYAESIFMNTKVNSNLPPNALSTMWPRIDAGYTFGTTTYKGTVIEYSPSAADYNNNTSYSINLSYPPGFMVNFTETNVGTGLHCDTSIYDNTMGTNTDYVWWRAASNNLLNYLSPTILGMTVKPALAFYTPPPFCGLLCYLYFLRIQQKE